MFVIVISTSLTFGSIFPPTPYRPSSINIFFNNFYVYKLCSRIHKRSPTIGVAPGNRTQHPSRGGSGFTARLPHQRTVH